MVTKNVLLVAWKYILKEAIKMNKKYSSQRKTTLKWNNNGELSEVDMLRVLNRISSSELNQCELTCDLED
tara:strand:+ start:529 stop:738 length:210 start_codon:yes stop_codon:yes gene_type:complete